MRSVISVVIIMMVLLFSTILGSNILEKRLTQIDKKIDEVVSFIEKNDTNKAKQEHENIKSEFKRLDLFLTLTIKHIELHDLDISVMKLGEYINLEEKNEAIVEATQIKAIISHVIADSKFTVNNMF